MCLGEFGTIVATSPDGFARVRFADGSVRRVSTAVLVADGVPVAPGDSIVVSMGLALRTVDPHRHDHHRRVGS